MSSFPSTSPLLSRRSFLAASAAGVALALLSSSRVLGAITSQPKFPAYPFQLGVASGDPSADGFVLWTRLAPEPLKGGGMKNVAVEVSWQIAEDEAMTRIVSRGTAVADPAWAHSVHVEVAGLKPDRWYWYRFKAGAEISPLGRTRTMPAPGTVSSQLNFAFASCQKYEMGYYTAYEHMAREDLDLIVHLGDYIYEKGDDKLAVRPHGTQEIFTIDDYRHRYAVYKSDPALQAAHAMAPWIVTWDDHEVSNNYANAISERSDVTTEQFLERRAAGYKAYYEHMPLRLSSLPKGADMLLYRRLEFGGLASFHVLDTRQYRTDQPLGDGLKADNPVLMDPRGTLMGEAQRKWLFDGLDRSQATWNILAQQIMVARMDSGSGDDTRYSMDKWPGYEFERRQLLHHFHEHKTRNPVVITGDIHNNWANELIADFDRLESRTVATEFVGTSISSGGDGSELPEWMAAVLPKNPFIKFNNDERGYVRCKVTPTEWRTDYRTVPYITRPGAPLTTRASFVVESGRPQLQRV